MRTSVIAVLSLTALTACGGGGGTTTTVTSTIPSAPFFNTPNTFNIAAQRNVVTTTGITTVPNAPITITTQTTGGNKEILLTVNGITFTLADTTPANFNGEVFTGSIGNQVVELQTRFGTDSARVAFLDVQVGTSSRDLEYVLYGFETAASAVSARTGVANYSGTTEAAIFDQNAFSRVAGTATLTSNFDTNAVSGTLSYTAALVGLPPFTVFDIDLDAATIAGNGASGTISPMFDPSVAANIVGTTGGYDATFYGTNGENVGGEWTFTGTFNGTPLVMQGSYLGVEQ